jgi:hypothetical protein
VSYSPLTSLSKKQSNAFTLRPKLPDIEETHRLRQPNVSPDQYNPKDEVARSTRYSKILVGGSGPKNQVYGNKNPGPGEYMTCNTISDISKSKAQMQSSSFASTMGKSWYSTQVSPNGSPRACAFTVPHSGGQFNEHGFMKDFNPKYRESQNFQLAHAMTKCAEPKKSEHGSGTPGAKTLELLDYLRMNDRILRFKKNTVKNIEDATYHKRGSP